LASTGTTLPGSGSRRSRTTGSEESVLRVGLGMLRVVLFLEEQVGAGGEEGVRRVLAGDHRNSVAILGGETPEHVEDLRCLAHRLADIAQRVGELLQLAGVGLDIHVALDQAPELSLR
jgi:hypothetical protein